MSQVDFGIQVLVSTKNARAATRQLQKELNKTGAAGANAGSRTQKGMNAAQKSVLNLQKQVGKLIVAFGGIFIVPKIIRLLDTYQQLENRLRVVARAGEDLSVTFNKLESIADSTRSSLTGTVELYARLALATKEMALQQATLLQVTKSINQAIIVSGASAKEAENGLIQLSQGLASGALRGDELRSVLEQLPRVADVIAKRLGVTRGELRKLGEAGALASGLIIDAFLQDQAALDREFAKTQETVGQAMVLLQNRLIGLTETSASTALVLETVRITIKAITALLPALIAGTVAAGLAFVGYKIAASSAVKSTLALSASQGMLAKSATFARVAMNGLGNILSKHPVLRIATVVFGAVAAFTGLKSALGGVNDELEDTNQKLSEFPIDQRYAETLKDLEVNMAALKISLMQFQAGDKSKATFVAGFSNEIGNLRETLAALRSPFDEVTKKLEDELTGLKMSTDQREHYNKMLAITNQLAKAGIDLNAEQNAGMKMRINDLLILIANQKAYNEEVKTSEAISDSWVNMIKESKASLNDHAAELRMDADEYRKHNIALRMSNSLHEEKGELTKEEVDEIMRLAALEADYIRLLENKNAVMSTITDDTLTQLQLDELVAAGAISQAEAQQYLAEQIRKTKEDTEDLSTALWEGFAQTALSNTENAIADFAVRGKGSFKTFVNAVLEDLLRMITRLLILLPLINALKSAFNIGGSPEGSQMGLDDFGNSISLDVPGKQNGGSWLVGQGVPAFANGGSMMVGGNGGTDSQLVAFRASPNERVTVTRPEQSIGGNTTVNVSVHNNAPGTEARVEQGENGDYRVIIDQLKGAIAGDISRGGTGLNAALEGRYGLNGAAGIQLG